MAVVATSTRCPVDGVLVGGADLVRRLGIYGCTACRFAGGAIIVSSIPNDDSQKDVMTA